MNQLGKRSGNWRWRLTDEMLSVGLPSLRDLTVASAHRGTS
jgi:hypothetical protein